MDISPEHLALWHRMVEHFSSDGNDIAVFFAIYTLMPYAVYPTQLQEGVEAFSYVVNELGRDPSDIILSGDSAGGNLCVAIASQLKRPSPDVTKVPIEKQVRGMLLMSPWLSFDVTYQSMIDNLPKDIDNPKSLVEWAKLYLSGRESNYYTEPILAPTDWWSDIPVKNTFIVAGSDEIFVDSIKLFAETFQVIFQAPVLVDVLTDSVFRRQERIPNWSSRRVSFISSRLSVLLWVTIGKPKQNAR